MVVVVVVVGVVGIILLVVVVVVVMVVVGITACLLSSTLGVSLLKVTLPFLTFMPKVYKLAVATGPPNSTPVADPVHLLSHRPLEAVEFTVSPLNTNVKEQVQFLFLPLN